MDKIKRILSIVLALVMVVTMLPSSIFAETYLEDQKIKTTDWSESAIKDEAKRSDYWNLAPKNKLIKASNTSPIRTPSINFIGTYVNSDGRTVIRLAYTGNQTATSDKLHWRKFAIKAPDAIENYIDWLHPGTGMYQCKNNLGKIANGMHDNEKFIKVGNFSQGSFSQTGESDTHVIDLNDNKNNPGSNSKLIIPIDLVLKENINLKDNEKFKEDLLFQARIYDNKFENVYMNADKTEQAYNAYTFSTTVPLKDDYKKYLGLSLNNGYGCDKFGAALTQIKYNRENGYIDVYYKQYKEDTGIKANAKYGFRQAVDSKFYNLLKEKNRVVAHIFIADRNGKPYQSNPKEYPNNPENLPQTRFIPVTKNELNVIDGVGFLQVVHSTEWNNRADYDYGIKSVTTTNQITDSLINSTVTGTNSGVYTIVRYYVDPTKIETAFKSKGLEFYSFFTSVIEQNPGTSEFEYTMNESISLNKGDTVTLDFSNDVDNDQNVEIIVKGQKNNINFYSSVKRQGKGNKKFTWTVPFGMTFEAGDKIKVRAVGNKGKLINNLQLTFNDTVFDTVNLTCDKLHYEPNSYKWSESMTGGTLVRSSYKPNVDEIFTDSKNLTGHVNYEGAKVTIKMPNNDEMIEQEIYAKGRNSEDSDLFSVMSQANVNGEETWGFKFDTFYPNEGGYVQGNDSGKSFTLYQLEKDMPIEFANTDVLNSSLISYPDVIEQVQAKFIFDLNGQSAKANGLQYIEKIAPLNKEYKYDPETGKANANYIPSGFAGDNIKYGKEKTKKITENINGEQVEKNYQNILNHDGLEYDTDKKDQKEAFLKRQMPTKEEINLPQGKRILGWTTKKINDIKDGKTAAEQFRDLKDNNEIVTDVNDWKKVDKGENYIFDEKSPIDKERTVYAVYGEGINIILHSNNTNDPKNETIVTIPITLADIDATNALIDATTSASLKKIRGQYVAKELPKAPYYNKGGTLEGDYDEALKTFNITDHSFIGWTAKRFTNDPKTSTLRAGNNNERIGEMERGFVIVDREKKETLKRTEGYSFIGQSEFEQKRFIPNGFSVSFKGDDQNFKNIKEMIENGLDIDLYANYRPFFDVEVIHSFKNISPKQDITNNPPIVGEYVDNVEDFKKYDVKIGLLYRTAVTDYGKPTVHADANYYPLKNELKNWLKDNPSNLKWKVPGFDELGQRRSYVSVIVTDENSFNNFTKDNWGALGIKTHVRVDSLDGTAIRDKNAPLNIHRDAGNPYGDPLAKDQAYNIGVDAYTSATSRKSKTYELNSKKEVTGYTIYNTSTPVDIPKPVFDPVKNTDNSFNLKWFLAEKNAQINKIKLNIPGTGEVTLEKQSDGSYKSGNITAIINGDKLNVGTVDLENQAGNEITAKYLVEKAGQDFEGPIGRIEIEEQKTSSKVENMRQIKNDVDGSSKIEFLVPNPILNKPTKGTVYEAQKWNKNNNQWETVGIFTQNADNETGTNQIIKLNNVDHDDIIRIKTTQPDQIPNYSTSTGSAYNPDDEYTPIPEKNGKEYIKIDRKAPNPNVKAEDEAFRRFIDLKGKIDELPYDRKAIVRIKYSSTDIAEKTFEVREDNTAGIKSNMIDYISEILRKGIDEGNIPEITIIAADKFGNSKETNIDYTPTNQLKVFVRGERAGKKFVKVSSDMSGAKITITVTGADGTNKAEGTANVTDANQFVKLTFKKDGADYSLESGDELSIEGSAKKDEKDYTSNPFMIYVK